MKKISSLILIIVLGCGLWWGYNYYNQKKLDGTSKIFNYYYMNKDQNDALLVLNSFDDVLKLQRENEKNDIVGPFIYFFVGVISENPGFVEFAKQHKLSSEAGAFINDVSQKYKDLKEQLFSDSHPVSGRMLDYFWGYFGATGDEKALEKIGGSMLNIVPVNGKVGPEAFVGLSAAWSLNTRAKKEEKVRNYVERLKQDSRLSDYMRKFLK